MAARLSSPEAEADPIKVSTDRIAIHALPYGHDLFDYFVMYLERRPREKWVVIDKFGYFYAPGNKVSRKMGEEIITYDPANNNKEIEVDEDYGLAEWPKLFWLDLVHARELAQELVGRLTFKGKAANEYDDGKPIKLWWEN